MSYHQICMMYLFSVVYLKPKTFAFMSLFRELVWTRSPEASPCDENTEGTTRTSAGFTKFNYHISVLILTTDDDKYFIQNELMMSLCRGKQRDRIIHELMHKKLLFNLVDFKKITGNLFSGAPSKIRAYISRLLIVCLHTG